MDVSEYLYADLTSSEVVGGMLLMTAMMPMLMMYIRSTKGASRQRRSLINHEIVALRQLLPVSDCARQRLSQLQTMSLACIFIRKYQLLGPSRESASLRIARAASDTGQKRR